MIRGLLILIVCLMASTRVSFGADALDARFALHVKVPTTKWLTICATYNPNVALTPCDSYVITSDAVLAYTLVYMVVGHAPAIGVSGVSFGLDYNGRFDQQNGIDPRATFYMCADGLAFDNDGGFGSFPAPKGGTLITWQTCANTQIPGAGVHAVIGALSVYAYADDLLRITPNNQAPRGPELAVTTCDGSTTDLLAAFPQQSAALMGKVALGPTFADAAFNPCLTTEAKASTWGRIKGFYRN